MQSAVIYQSENEKVLARSGILYRINCNYTMPELDIPIGMCALDKDKRKQNITEKEKNKHEDIGGRSRIMFFYSVILIPYRGHDTFFVCLFSSDLGSLFDFSSLLWNVAVGRACSL